MGWWKELFALPSEFPLREDPRAWGRIPVSFAVHPQAPSIPRPSLDSLHTVTMGSGLALCLIKPLPFSFVLSSPPPCHWLYSLYIKFFQYFAFFPRMPHPNQFPGQCCSLSYPISISVCPQEKKGGRCLINIVCIEFGFTMWTIWSGYNYLTLGYQKGRSAPSPTRLASHPCCFAPLREGDPSSPKLHIMFFLSTCSLPKIRLGAEDTGNTTVWLGTYRNRQPKSYVDIPWNKAQCPMGPHTMVS